MGNMWLLRTESVHEQAKQQLLINYQKRIDIEHQLILVTTLLVKHKKWINELIDKLSKMYRH